MYKNNTKILKVIFTYKNNLTKLKHNTITDLGIAQIKNNKTEMDKSYAIENIVYNDLIIKGYDVYTGKTKKGEIDFVATKSGEKNIYKLHIVYQMKKQ